METTPGPYVKKRYEIEGFTENKKKEKMTSKGRRRLTLHGRAWDACIAFGSVWETHSMAFLLYSIIFENELPDGVRDYSTQRHTCTCYL